ncbi:MAG TPA: glycosyltransferase, partial [Terriglobales bacterium]|nr:glycosyltransferase [Terriglobales bacterium]
PYYGAADVVVLPAVQEAFGNVVLEALASGVPVVANEGVGAAELFAGSIAGEVVRKSSHPAQLEAQLAAMLERAREPATRRAARELGERYSWENHYRALEKCLSSLCRQAADGSPR